MKTDSTLIDQIKSHLDKSLEEIDSRAASRIAEARIRALDTGPRRSLAWLWPAAGLVAATAVLLVVLSTKPEPIQVVVNPPRKTAAPEAIVSDNLELFEMIADETDVDLYENMDFYTWLLEHGETQVRNPG